MTPREAIEAAGLAGAEIAYRNQVGREMYQAGHADGYQAGYRQAEADQAARWNQITRPTTDGPSHAELEERRWGPGGREAFGNPLPGDFPGHGTQPQTEPEPEVEASP
jgi:hypothetical protein